MDRVSSTCLGLPLAPPGRAFASLSDVAHSGSRRTHRKYPAASDAVLLEVALHAWPPLFGAGRSVSAILFLSFRARAVAVGASASSSQASGTCELRGVVCCVLTQWCNAVEMVKE